MWDLYNFIYEIKSTFGLSDVGAAFSKQEKMYKEQLMPPDDHCSLDTYYTYKYDKKTVYTSFFYKRNSVCNSKWHK